MDLRSHPRARMGGALAAALAGGALLASSVGAAPAPGKDACKNGGWQALGFKNQGQCVAAANAAAHNNQPFPPPPPPTDTGGGGGTT